jgi:F0F1-type ATP synthase membrane subunit b/b'
MGQESSEKQKPLLERIIDGAIDAIRRPFTIKRIQRAFDSAADSIEEQLLAADAKQAKARENLVKAAESEEKLGTHIQHLIEIQAEIRALKEADKDLKKEKSELL